MDVHADCKLILPIQNKVTIYLIVVEKIEMKYLLAYSYMQKFSSPRQIVHFNEFLSEEKLTQLPHGAEITCTLFANSNAYLLFL